MDLELGGKVALVTGASRGIGRAIAEGLAVEGARRAWRGDGAAAFTPDEARALIERIDAQPGFVEWLPYAEGWKMTQTKFYTSLGDSARELRARIREALDLEAAP